MSLPLQDARVIPVPISDARYGPRAGARVVYLRRAHGIHVPGRSPSASRPPRVASRCFALALARETEQTLPPAPCGRGSDLWS